MKSILIIGMGRFGHHLAHNFLENGHDVMIVDEDEEKLSDIAPYATSTRIGDCTNEEVLKSLGIGNFDVVFVCIGTNFQSSLEVTSLVRRWAQGGSSARRQGTYRRNFCCETELTR